MSSCGMKVFGQSMFGFDLIIELPLFLSLVLFHVPRNNTLAAMARAGVTAVEIQSVEDNLPSMPLEPGFIGYCHSCRHDSAAKVRKRKGKRPGITITIIGKPIAWWL